MPNSNFTNPDPYSWLASAGEFSASDVFGPPSNVLEATYDGYPGATSGQVQARSFGTGDGKAPFWADPAIHGLIFAGVGAFLVYQFTKE